MAFVNPTLGTHSFVHDILVALALLLVIEGIWPFLNPASFRRALAMIAAEGERPLRISGLISMLAGLGLLYLVN
ncbi:DUF2065 domain-containing protein [Thiocystis minor]|uniref:DUF2065 domain-containing protein n=1 Tax=Thiocystis minor TaxID=61597 RepID=UPI001911984B|nr:DUF2065 domain-containing protein [Thiocystis minor]MBK5962751.1 DUF2065 domain-containing protein [Thiocystis minor]